MRTEQEEEDNKRNSDAAVGLLFALSKLFFLLLKIAAIFGVFIYAGYLLSKKIFGDDGVDKLKIWGFAIIFTYLMFCIIFFLKGIIIGLRKKEQKLWILPWLVCVFACCLVPAFVIRAAFSGFFNPAQLNQVWYLVMSWAVFGASAFYIYNLYEFKTPSAARLVHWSYSLGLKITGYI